jgi:hypothetical protein
MLPFFQFLLSCPHHLSGRYNDKVESIALPMLKRPTNLDGSHAGDYGFDPLGFTESYDLYTMQEAELRHARLAMLAVVGWPVSELVAPSWMLQENGCAPSVLNGFNPISFLATALALGAFGFFEYKTSLRSTWGTQMGQTHREDMAQIWDLGVAGDYSFDPLNLYSSILGDSAVARKGLREVEISHGRMAMLGIAGFAMQEAITKHPVVENSMFFHPNLLLPSLVAGYTAFRMIYKVEHNDQFVFQVSTSSEGQAMLENLKLQLPKPDPVSSEEAYGKINDTIEAVKKIVGGAADAAGVEKLSMESSSSSSAPKLALPKVALPESPKSLLEGIKKVYQDNCL